jgi:integral membrane protein
MTSSAIRQLRIIGLCEGASFLVLLGIAMPLKYLAGMPGAVRAVGMAHGVLFVLYVAALVHVQLTAQWRLKRSLALFVAAILPLGPFLAERWLRDQQRIAAEQEATPVSLG